MRTVQLSDTKIAIVYPNKVRILEQTGVIDGIPQVNERVLKGQAFKKFIQGVS